MKRKTGCPAGRYVKNFLVIAFVLMFSLTLSGCDSDQKSNGKSPAAGSGVSVNTGTDKKETQKEVTLYFPDSTGEKLSSVKAKIKGEAPVKELALLLLEGPGEKERAAGMIRPFPKGVRLLGVTVKDKLAKVDFSKELAENFQGGSTGEIMLAASLVNTLTEVPEIKRVQVLVEGKEIESLSGHLDFSEPMERFKEY